MQYEVINKIKLKFIAILNNIFVKIFVLLLAIFSLYLIHKLYLFQQEINNIKPALGNNSSLWVTSVEIPDSIYFANERVPSEYFDVYESLDREFLVNTYWHSQTMLMLKKAYRFFPVIEPILKKHQIPDDFKYLVIAESGFSNIVSPAGASGFWQFMKPTAEKYGLIINEEIDERYNLEKATVAACKHLNDLYACYKNWTIVAAAYNIGGGNLDKIISNQKTSNYYDLFFNEETARYVYRIIAIKTIIESPKKYGFYISKQQRYLFIPTEKYTVDSTIHDLSQFAKDKGINYKILRLFNPWLRKYKLTATTENQFVIQIPKPAFRDMKILQREFNLYDTLPQPSDTINE
jgi:hypothetical protein